MKSYHRRIKGYGDKYAYYDENGYMHRLDGPASEFMEEYYVHGFFYSEKGYWKHPLVVKYKKIKFIRKLINE